MSFIIAKNFSRRALYAIPLCILSICPMILVTALTPQWYHYNYQKQSVSQKIDPQLLQSQTNNLIHYFIGSQQLNNHWAAHEKLHMKDVRKLFYLLMILIGLTPLMFFFSFKMSKEHFINDIRLTSIAIIVIMLCLSLLIWTQFQFFWRNIFHPLLFNHGTWHYYRGDMSYYMFPLSFFMRTFALLCLSLLIINITIIMTTSITLWLYNKKNQHKRIHVDFK